MHRARRVEAKRTRTFARCSLSPFYFCLVSHDDFECSNERAGHTGHTFISSLLDAAGTPSVLAQPPHSFSSARAWILISALGDLPFLRTLCRTRSTSCLQARVGFIEGCGQRFAS